MSAPTPLKELLSTTHSLGATYGKTKGVDAKVSAYHDMVIAKMAYSTAKFIDNLQVMFTQEDADYIYKIMTDRIASQTVGE